MGIALDAAARGFSTVLLEAHDFAKGTSSRATKLVHGGVRYLAQGNVGLVREALRERRNILANAPHLAQPLAFLMPAYSRRHLLMYGAGLKVYDAIAGSASVGPTQILGRQSAADAASNLVISGLRGGVRYWDGQFDDARLALAIGRTAAANGALLLNHCEVSSLTKTRGKISGLSCRDAESGLLLTVKANCVVNATGVWADRLVQMDRQSPSDPASVAPKAVRPSQGTHVVVDRSFWPCNEALLIPDTADGRVLFAVPWMGVTLLGTTDTPRTDAPFEPAPLAEEIDFILRESRRYLQRAPTRADVMSAWAGLRPLANGPTAGPASTSKVSREHMIQVSPSGLVTITGGKWTTYRAMAEQALTMCMDVGLLDRRPGSTERLRLVGAQGDEHKSISAPPGYHLYGGEAQLVRALPGAAVTINPALTEAMVRFAARYEYARTTEDVLARRSRLLFLNARAARAAAPRVAAVLEEETGADPQLGLFLALCDQYEIN